LHELNHTVLVFDADFTKNNMLEHLDLDIHALPVNIGHILNGDAHINDAVYRHVTGLRIMPSIIHGYDNFSYYFQDLLADYDYILLDTPEDVRYLDIVLDNANEAIIVHSPLYSSKIVKDAIAKLAERKILNLGIVLNKSNDNSVDSLFDTPVIAKIPMHKDVEKSFIRKHPVVHTHPKGVVAKKFRRLAEKLS